MQNFLFSIVALAAVSFSPSEANDKSGQPSPPGETKRVRWASEPPARQKKYRAPRIKGNPIIDADWEKAVWRDVTPVTLEYYMGSEPTHQPKVQAKVAYDDDALYLIWKVNDKNVLAKRTQHTQDVYRDSCVEFFFTPCGEPKERGFFNLETNCVGVKLFGVHVTPGDDEAFTVEEISSLVTSSSLKGPIDTEISDATTWTLEYRIPLSLLEKFAKVERPGPGVTWRGNFYKCADETSQPHWLTWSPVSNAEPSFHLPEYFGVIDFE